jgi:hypothetical protein
MFIAINSAGLLVTPKQRAVIFPIQYEYTAATGEVEVYFDTGFRYYFVVIPVHNSGSIV